MDPQQPSQGNTQTPQQPASAETPATPLGNPNTAGIPQPVAPASPTGDTTVAGTTPHPVVPNTTASTPPTSPKKSKAPLIITFILILLVILAGAYYFILRQSSQPQAVSTQKTVVNTPTPPHATPTLAVKPVTPDNVDQTLNNTDQQVQQTVTQTDTDLKAVSTISPSQDNTSGL